MQVNSTLNNIRRRALQSILQDAEPLQEHLLEEVVLVLAGLNDALGDDLAGFRSKQVQFRIIHFKLRLVLEPAETDEKTVDNACTVFFAAGFLGEEDDILGDYLGVGTGDLGFF